MNYVRIGSLSVAKALHEFIEQEAAPGTSLSAEAFWSGFAELLRDCGTRNRQLLQVRDELQSCIDQYHRERFGEPLDLSDYERFLRDIGYVLPEGNDFAILTTNVDDEIAVIAGPQLVVPLSNARYALNAANARWGSLYDALYGTDAIPEDGGATRTGTYNKIRGERVVARARAMLDASVPLARGSHRDVVSYSVAGANLLMRLGDGTNSGLARPAQFAGYRHEASAPSAVLLRNHGLHLEIKIDRGGLVGRDDPAGIADIVLESAVTTIMDLEDSIAAVDAQDKVAVYRNWLGLIKGTLTATFQKGGRTVHRQLNPDRVYTAAGGGGELRLPGRSLMLVRNVGHHMYTDAVLDASDNEVPEGMLDAAVTALIALRDVAGPNAKRNSRTGSIYIVKPKMHGPDEVAFANELLERVEDMLSLPRYTLKVGIMDEERRTSINLKQCIRAAADRAIFINTGFLDRWFARTR